MKVFILLSVVAVAFARQQCGENEHYTTCGTDCPLTCENYKDAPLVCNFMCRIGCECDSGYVRSADGRCVRPEECPARAQQCGENQHYTSCGTDCPLTCDNYSNPPKFCNLMCRIGCECDEGFVETHEGRCIRSFQCPQNSNQECGENQHYTSCGTTCPLTCDNYSNPPKICNLMCKIGCECDEGFVETREGRCIRSFQCPVNASRVHEQTCTEKPEPGMCLAYIPSYYYDVETGTCKKFIYGGCQGNGNRYGTEEECLAKCQGVKASPAACTLPSETGVCRGNFPRFFYDVQSGSCKEFVYGGCGGNENNFETVQECESACAPRRAPEACQLEKVVGPCKASFPRFFHNKETGQCELFIYGGCNGNSNNFNSKDECEAVCSTRRSAPQACQLEKVVGRCRGYFPRFYHNKETGQCEEFIYGGCDGNSNNFNTKDECESVCLD